MLHCLVRVTLHFVAVTLPLFLDQLGAHLNGITLARRYIYGCSNAPSSPAVLFGGVCEETDMLPRGMLL